MRIILLCAQYPPDRSGIGDYTHFAANALAKQGHEVEIVTSIGARDSVSYPTVQGVRLHRSVAGWGIRYLPQNLGLLREVPQGTVILQYAPHAFARRGIALAPSLLPWLLRFSTNHRVVVNFHEICIPLSFSPIRFAGSLWQRFMAFLVGSPANALSAVTSQWARQLRRCGLWKQVTVIPVGSNIPLASIDAIQRNELRYRLGVRNDVLVGSFGPSGVGRDAELLLKVFAQLRLSHRVRLVLLGAFGVRRGSDWRDVVRTGYLPHEDVSRVLSSCDVFVLPFRMGVSARRTTAVAALLHGLPLLTTRGPATDDVFLEGESVFLAPAGSSTELLAALERLVENQELRIQLGTKARFLHASYFDWEVISRRLAELALDLETVPDRRHSK